MIIGTRMWEWQNLWNANRYVCEYGMLGCWNSRGCAGLGTLYILSIVVVMIDDMY